MKVDIYHIGNKSEKTKRTYLVMPKGKKELPIQLKECSFINEMDIDSKKEQLLFREVDAENGFLYMGTMDVKTVLKDLKEKGHALVEIPTGIFETTSQYSKNLGEMYGLLRRIKYATNASFSYLFINEDDSLTIKVEKFIPPNKEKPTGKMAQFTKHLSAVEVEHIEKPEIIIDSFIQQVLQDKNNE